MGRIYDAGLDVLGGDTLQDVMSVVHPIGKGILSAFGAGQAGEALEELEKKEGILPGGKRPEEKPAADVPAKAPAPAGPVPMTAAQRKKIAEAEVRLRVAQAARSQAEARVRKPAAVVPVPQASVEVISPETSSWFSWRAIAGLGVLGGVAWILLKKPRPMGRAKESA